MVGGKRTKDARVCGLLREAHAALTASPQVAVSSVVCAEKLVRLDQCAVQYLCNCPWKDPSDFNPGTQDAGFGFGLVQSPEGEESGENVKALEKA